MKHWMLRHDSAGKFLKYQASLPPADGGCNKVSVAGLNQGRSSSFQASCVKWCLAGGYFPDCR